VGSRNTWFGAAAEAKDAGTVAKGTGGAAQISHEGRSNWTTTDFATTGRTFYELTVSGVVVVPSGDNETTDSVYTSGGGNVLKCRRVEIVAGSGILTFELSSGSAPSGSGTLTNSSGVGDASISFSATAAVSGNPFWHSGLSFADYASAFGVAIPDIVELPDATNNILTKDDTTIDAAITTILANYDAMIAQAQSDWVSAEIWVPTMYPTPLAYSAMGIYSNGSIANPQYRRVIHKANLAIIEKYRGLTGSGIRLIDYQSAFDVEHCWQKFASAVRNPFTDDTVQVTAGGPHSGPKSAQMGELIYAMAKS